MNNKNASNLVSMNYKYPISLRNFTINTRVETSTDNYGTWQLVELLCTLAFDREVIDCMIVALVFEYGMMIVCCIKQKVLPDRLKTSAFKQVTCSHQSVKKRPNAIYSELLV